MLGLGLSLTSRPALSTGGLRTFYVDSENGDDADNGLTEATAFATVAGLPTLRASDTVSLANGSTWRDKLLCSVASVSYTFHGAGDPPTFRGDKDVIGIAADWTDTGSNRWTRAHVTSADITTPMHLSINGATATLKQVSQVAVDAAGEWYWAASVLTVYATSNPASAYTSIDIDDRPCIQVTAEGVTLEGIRATKGHRGIEITAANCTLTDCVSTLNSQDGIKLFDDASGAVITGTQSTYNGTYPAQGCHGLHVGAATTDVITGVLVDDCVFSHNGEDGYQGYAAPGVRVATITNTTMENNGENSVDIKNGEHYFCESCVLDQTGTNANAEPITIHTNASAKGIFEDSIIRGRTQVSTAGTSAASGSNASRVEEGAVLELRRNDIAILHGLAASINSTAGNNCVVEANRIVKSGTSSVSQCINVAGGTGHKINHNTMVAATSAVAAQGLRLQNTAVVAEFCNNIVYLPNTTAARYCLDISAGASVTLHRNNLYFRGSTDWNRDSNVGSAPGPLYTEAETDAWETGVVTADPLFTNYATLDLTLQGTSPALDAGLAGLSVATDFLGAAYGSPPNIGCYATP